MQKLARSNLMYLSWEIQHKRKSNRSRALASAWAIYLNEDIAVYHLVKKHTPVRQAHKVRPESLTLFPSKFTSSNL